MPRELIATAPGQAALQEYQEPDLAVGEIRIQTIFSSVNHGSGRRSFRADSKDYTSPFDRQRGIHHGPPVQPSYPKPLGNMAVGEVVEVGCETDQWQIGNQVFSLLPIRETHIVKSHQLKAVPTGMSAQAVVHSNPAEAPYRYSSQSYHAGQCGGCFWSGGNWPKNGGPTGQTARSWSAVCF